MNMPQDDVLDHGYGVADIVDEMNDDLDSSSDDGFSDAASRIEEAQEVRDLINGDVEADMAYQKGYLDGYQAASSASGGGMDTSFFGNTGKRAEAFISKLGGKSSVESGGSKLPPVYVEDPKSVDVALEDEHSGASMVMESSPVEVKDTFGNSAVFGTVGRQARKRSQNAAQKALQNGAYVFQTQPSEGGGGPFVQDESATPYLLSSGMLVEPAYGELVAGPCPSCADLSKKAAFSGQGEDCIVCAGYGAILLPKDDVGAFLGMDEASFAQAVYEDGSKVRILSSPEHL